MNANDPNTDGGQVNPPSQNTNPDQWVVAPESPAPAARKRRISRTAAASILLLLVLGTLGLTFTSELLVLFERLTEVRTRGSIDELEKNFDHPFSADERVMYGLSHFDGEISHEAIEKIKQSGDKRFIPVLIEMLRGSEMAIAAGAGGMAHWQTLKQLSGQNFPAETDPWIAWYGTTDIKPPDRFTSWKGQLLARVDPRYSILLTDDLPCRIRVEEIQHGGVRVDGIPPLNHPKMIKVADADFLYPHEPVVGITQNGESRAYPLRIIDWHEMVNDVVGGVPVSLAYCTLCGAAIAFEGRDAEGETCTFGTSGLLYRSNKLMYDRRTKTLWNQFTGEPVLGKQAVHEFALNILPSVVTKWEDWRTDHPDTLVLSRATGHERDYSEPGRAYGAYFASGGTMFAVPGQSALLPAKSRVFGLDLDGVRRAYPLDIVAESKVINDTVGQTQVVLVAMRGPVKVHGSSSGGQTYGYQAGAEVRAFDRSDHAFVAGAEPNVILDSDGRSWRATEDALVGPAGESLPRLPGTLAFWFGWYAFHSDTRIYSGPQPTAPPPATQSNTDSSPSSQ